MKNKKRVRNEARIKVAEIAAVATEELANKMSISLSCRAKE